MNFVTVKKIHLTADTAYLAGLIIGDGHLANSTKSKTDLSPDYQIMIDISDIDFLSEVHLIIKSIINTKSVPKESKVRGNRISRHYLCIRNKHLFYFLNRDMEIPKGKKSDTIIVPKLIIGGSGDAKKHFLAGYFDADGGFRGQSLGFTTASKDMNKGVSSLLTYFGIEHGLDSWINQKYGKRFFGIRIKVSMIDRFLKEFPLRNVQKLHRIHDKFTWRCRSGQTG